MGYLVSKAEDIQNLPERTVKIWLPYTCRDSHKSTSGNGSFSRPVSVCGMFWCLGEYPNTGAKSRKYSLVKFGTDVGVM